MPISKTIGSTSYSVPVTGERSWGADATTLLERLADEADKIASLIIPVTSADLEIQDGLGQHGILANFIKGYTSTAVADAGFLRLTNPEKELESSPADTVNYAIAWRNYANNGNLLLYPTSDTELSFAGTALLTATSTSNLENKTLEAPVINTSVSGSAILDEDDMASDSDTQLATQQSIKAYVDAHESATTGVHGVTGDIADTQSSQTLENKTITAPVIDGSVSGTAILDEDNMASNSDTQLATQQSIKAYADAHSSQVDIHRTFIESTTAARPAAGTAGRFHYSTDDSQWSYDNGAIWVAVEAPPKDHTHDASDVISGTLDDGRVAESNVTQHEAAIDHDALTNFAANEHVDHSTVDITTGEGLTGGGDLTTSRTLDLDINGLTAESTIDGAADYVAVYDASAAAHRKVLLGNIGSDGAGEINYIENSEVDINTDGWIESGGGRFDRTTSIGEVLRGIASLKIYSIGAGAVKYEFAVPEADTNKLLKVSFDCKTLGSYATGDLAVTVQDPSAANVLDAAEIPAGQGRVEFTFASTDAGTYELFFVASGAISAANGLIVDNIVVGPGRTVSGAAVGAGTHVTLSASDFSNSTGLTIAGRLSGQRVGDSLHLVGVAQFSGTGSVGSDLLLNLPSEFGSLTFASGNYPGLELRLDNATVTNRYPRAGSVIADGTGALGFEINTTSSNPINGNSFGDTGSLYDEIFFDVLLPVNEWAGSGTLNVGQNEVEYAYNTDTSDANDTTSFGYGPGGTAFPSSALTTFRDKTVQFRSDIQPTDIIQLQVDQSGNGDWVDIGSMAGGLISGRLVEPLRIQNGVNYGIGIKSVGSNNVVVRIGQYSYASGSTYGAAGNAWSATTGAGKWRVVKHRAGQPVGFGLATSENVGLVKKNKWQVKKLTADLFTGDTGTVSDLGFSGLIVGKYYKLSTQSWLIDVNGTDAELAYSHDSSNILVNRLASNNTTIDHESISGSSIVFKATATTIVATCTIGTGSTIRGNNTLAETWAMLEELNNYEDETTDFS